MFINCIYTFEKFKGLYKSLSQKIIIGATGNHVYTSSYPAEFESFDGNADYLDDWVFDKVHKFFVDARKNETLNSQLRQDKVVFFLHLLGIDTNGHAFNPTSL